MTNTIGIVDLFSGPGGLAEGFSSYHSEDGHSPYRIMISIEKEISAHATMRLRSFLRRFPPHKLPSEYYDFLNGVSAMEPDWPNLYRAEWSQADEESQFRELGKPETRKFLQQRIRKIQSIFGDRTVLIGGPPCQAYSLAGRSRNAGNANYLPDKDERNYLYQEYVKVVGILEPAAFVMENVKGMLSSAVKGDGIIQKVMADLRNPESSDARYKLIAMAPEDARIDGETDPAPRDFIVRAEQFGIPQARHRVIIVGLRSDIADTVGPDHFPRLQTHGAQVSVRHVLSAMPKIRSGLSRNDSHEGWSNSVLSAIRNLEQNPPPNLNGKELRSYQRCISTVQKNVRDGKLVHLRSRVTESLLPKDCPVKLKEWLCDPRVSNLPNHETRGHMASDLSRYLFASMFGNATKRSPTSDEFPLAIAPNHRNWSSGKFGGLYT